jgi:hypothetical protein
MIDQNRDFDLESVVGNMLISQYQARLPFQGRIWIICSGIHLNNFKFLSM